jgi:trimethyllysine dioxygenase
MMKFSVSNFHNARMLRPSRPTFTHPTSFSNKSKIICGPYRCIVTPSHFGPRPFLTAFETSDEKDLVTVQFENTKTFTFHTQWLHDARCKGPSPSRDATSAFCQHPPTAQIQSVSTKRNDMAGTLDITWTDGTVTNYPFTWLCVMAPLVAKQMKESTTDYPVADGWLVNNLQIQEIAYSEIFPDHKDAHKLDQSIIHILDLLLNDSSSGIIKVVGLPPPNIEEERNKINTLVTRVLKQIFGSVFAHPRRGTDKTFNVSSHHEDDKKRGVGLHNYDTSHILLPHTDHAHYTHPIQVQGWYGLEGTSENTFVSSLGVLHTMRSESPELINYLCNTPMAMGRAAYYYDPPMHQGTVDTAVTMQPGYPSQVKRVRWHPHLTGSLLAPFDSFQNARRAHQKFQEIARRDTHQLKVTLKPGDLYIWDNFRILHGRERVFDVPRTGVGQTVPEQAVADRYRSLQINRLRDYIEDTWLVHIPARQLYDLARLVSRA